MSRMLEEGLPFACLLGGGLLLGSCAAPAARDLAAASDGGAVAATDAGVRTTDASLTLLDAGAAEGAAAAAGPDGLGPPTFAPGDLDPPSNGGTITFTSIGAKGWYPSRRDPAQGPCNAYDAGPTCCMAMEEVTSDALTPWDQELVLTLRGPLAIKQVAVYQPAASGADWQLVSGWRDDAPTLSTGLAFDGHAAPDAGWKETRGGIGSECSVNLATDTPFACGAGSSPFCPAGKAADYYGWGGSKQMVILAKAPHEGAPGTPPPCSKTTTGNWYDAPWMGLGLGELARAGAYGSCQCFAKDPAKWYLADGCGQFNVFEVVNDNNQYRNLDVFSTDLIDYSGYVGEGPCGPACDVSKIGADADLIDKKGDTAATRGATASPSGGPGAAFRRPANGYRYFLVLFDVPSRTIQLGLVHPGKVPTALTPLLPNLPGVLPEASISALLALRLPT